jgi:hypothetical protein
VAPSDVPLSWQLLESLSRLVGCDEIAFMGISGGHRTTSAQHAVTTTKCSRPPTRAPVTPSVTVLASTMSQRGSQALPCRTAHGLTSREQSAPDHDGRGHPLVVTG